MEETFWEKIRGYIVTIVAVAVAVVLIRLLQVLGYAGFSPLFGALIVSAWYGGIGPGTLGIILTTLAAYYLLPKASDTQLYREDFLRATVFTLTAMVAVVVHLAAKRAEEAAQRDKQAAERANEAKTRLLAMVSHDLQGPLNPILMAVAVAESDPVVAARANEPLRLIRSGLAEEIQLIEDLVDAARLATGKFKINPASVDIHKIIEKAVAACHDKLQDKQIQLEINLLARETQIHGDPVRLYQVFWNLLTNAIKFTPQDGHIFLRTHDAPAGQIAIEVRDTGIGIDPEKLPFIFNMFEQGGAEVTHRFGGLGLGLAICRGIIEAHAGSITATSPGEGQGATFIVRLPYSHTSAIPYKITEHEDSRSPGR